MTLRELILRLEAQPDLTEVASPAWGEGQSWRGAYEEIAFKPLPESTLGAMLDAARAMVGATLYGYKGGEYEATLDTQCNVAAWGTYGGDSDRMDVWWATNMVASQLRAQIERERGAAALARAEASAARARVTELEAGLRGIRDTLNQESFEWPDVADQVERLLVERLLR